MAQVVGHANFSTADQWNADMIVRPENLLPLVLRAARQQERWMDINQR